MEMLDKVMSESRLEGVVTTVKQDKGYGFISCASDGRDYFFHHSEVLRGSIAFKNILAGDVVSFFPEDNPDITKGPKAQAVRLESRVKSEAKSETDHVDETPGEVNTEVTAS
jgi:cold shock CspA family protein